MGDAAEKNDAQVGGNEASRIDVDLHTAQKMLKTTSLMTAYFIRERMLLL